MKLTITDDQLIIEKQIFYGFGEGTLLDVFDTRENGNAEIVVDSNTFIHIKNTWFHRLKFCWWLFRTKNSATILPKDRDFDFDKKIHSEKIFDGSIKIIRKTE